MSAELRIDHLGKIFAPGGAPRDTKGGGKPAVDDVSFTVAAGEIVALLGPSGCGKTTTLRCVAGLEHPTSGIIAIGGEIVSAPAEALLVPPRLRHVGMVFQSYAVWPHMTVWQNVAYPLRRRGLSKAELERRVAEALGLVGLEDYAKRSVVLLSGGQMQRVALARSLVYQPRLLLLDEPLSNLDANLRLRLRDDLRRIIKRTGVTALYVTHDQAEAVVLGDRIGVMREGKLLHIAPPAEIYNRPTDLFVARFTGAANLIDGRVVGRDGEFGTIEAGSGHRLTAWLPVGVATGTAVKIAVRPENVQCGPTNGAAGHNQFTARVVAQRYEGTQTVYDLSVLGGQLSLLELGTSVRHPIGSEVDITLPPALCWAYPEL
jgi:iron(III) transport system ATP-binding protein